MSRPTLRTPKNSCDFLPVISADTFLVPARTVGFDFFTGVPCSFLTPIINRVIGDARTNYVAAASEGEAVAIAAGAWLAGRGTVVMCQNSGLGNAINPLTSLNYPFRIPTLLIVTWRGAPGLEDEPQHELMGAVTLTLLETIRIPHAAFPTDEAAVDESLDAARAEMERTGLPYAFLMEKGSVRDDGLFAEPLERRIRGNHVDMRAGAPPPARMEALESLLGVLPPEAAVIVTTGKCGRELFTLRDRPQHLYQVGSMGCGGAMGLGVALNVKRPVVVVDGDGAVLMKMGTLATIGACAPANLLHIILDNGVYDSTGGQATVAPNVDFTATALACGYARGFSCDDLEGLEEAVSLGLGAPGPHLVHMRISPGSASGLGRPTVKPHEVAWRFKEFLAGT